MKNKMRRMTPTSPYGTGLAPILILAAVSLTGGCASSVQIEDTQARMPAATVTREITPRIGVQAGLNRISGEPRRDSEFSGSSGIELGDLIIEQPTTLTGEFDLTNVSLGIFLPVLDLPRFGINLQAGFRRSQLALTLIDDSDVRHTYRGSGYGPGGSVEFLLPLGAGFTALAHVEGSVQVSGDAARQTLWGVRLAYAPIEQVELFGGWFESEYTNTEHSSNIDITASGVSLGFNLRF